MKLLNCKGHQPPDITKLSVVTRLKMNINLDDRFLKANCIFSGAISVFTRLVISLIGLITY